MSSVLPYNELDRLSQIVFLGIRGRDVRGDIAIDKLRIVPGHCTGNTTLVYTH